MARRTGVRGLSKDTHSREGGPHPLTIKAVTAMFTPAAPQALVAQTGCYSIKSSIAQCACISILR